MEGPDNSAVEFLPILKRGPKRGQIFTKLFPPLSSLILGKYPRNIIIFPLTQTKIVFFFSPNYFKKGKLLGDWIFFLQQPNFSSGLAEKFCKELATLSGRWTNAETCHYLIQSLYSCTIWRIKKYWLVTDSFENWFKKMQFTKSWGVWRIFAKRLILFEKDWFFWRVR